MAGSGNRYRQNSKYRCGRIEVQVQELSSITIIESLAASTLSFEAMLLEGSLEQSF